MTKPLSRSEPGEAPTAPVPADRLGWWSRVEGRYLPYLLLLPSVLLLLALTVYPLIYSIRASLHAFRFGRMTSYVGSDNYAHILQDALFWGALKTTLIYTVSAVGLEFLLGLGPALLLHSTVRGAQFFRTVLMFPMMLSTVVVGVIWRLMYNPDAGVINHFLKSLGLAPRNWLADPALALPAVIVVDVWQWTPFMFLVLLAGLQSLPQEPFEAANIDGASDWQSFRYITLPMLKPMILVALLIRTMDAFRIFDQVFVLTLGGPGSVTETISLYIYKTAFKFWDIGYAAAMLFAVLALITVISQVYIKALRTEHVFD